MTSTPKISHTADEDARLRRLAISFGDLDEACGFVGALGRLKKSDSDFVNTRDALLGAFVIAYSRPFKRNAVGDNVAVRLEWAGLGIADPELARYHDFILRIRDQQFAHSDPGPVWASVEQVSAGNATVHMRNVRPPIDESAHEAYSSLAATVRDAIRRQLRELGVTQIVWDG